MGWYDPKDARILIPDGEHEATIKSATKEDKDGMKLVSKKGEAMQLVTFEVYHGEETRQLRQYFTQKSMMWMYKDLARALGKEADFEAGTFDAENHIGDGLILVVGTKKDDKYGEQNNISGFKMLSRSRPEPIKQERQPAKAMGLPTSDDIPF